MPDHAGPHRRHSVTHYWRRLYAPNSRDRHSVLASLRLRTAGHAAGAPIRGRPMPMFSPVAVPALASLAGGIGIATSTATYVIYAIGMRTPGQPVMHVARTARRRVIPTRRRVARQQMQLWFAIHQPLPFPSRSAGPNLPVPAPAALDRFRRRGRGAAADWLPLPAESEYVETSVVFLNFPVEPGLAAPARAHHPAHCEYGQPRPASGSDAESGAWRYRPTD